MKLKDRNINYLKQSKENRKSNVIGVCLIVIDMHICGEKYMITKKFFKNVVSKTERKESKKQRKSFSP